MKRPLEQYANCDPFQVVSGSHAQALFFAEDAKADIAELAAHLARLNAEFDQMVMECFEVISTTDVDQNGDHIEQRVPKHHLLAADVARLEAENERLRKALTNLVAAEDKYVADAGMKLDDPISDAVTEARAVLEAKP